MQANAGRFKLQSFARGLQFFLFDLSRNSNTKKAILCLIYRNVTEWTLSLTNAVCFSWILEYILAQDEDCGFSYAVITGRKKSLHSDIWRGKKTQKQSLFQCTHVRLV